MAPHLRNSLGSVFSLVPKFQNSWGYQSSRAAIYRDSLGSSCLVSPTHHSLK